MRVAAQPTCRRSSITNFPITQFNYSITQLPHSQLFLISLLLPLYDNDARPLPRALFQQVGSELTSRFGGLTAHTRAPAEGLWHSGEDARPTRDEIVIYEVVAEEVDRDWWREYRRQLEGRFRQEQVLIRAHEITLL
jgi:hypothetical protein